MQASRRHRLTSRRLGCLIVLALLVSGLRAKASEAELRRLVFQIERLTLLWQAVGGDATAQAALAPLSGATAGYFHDQLAFAERQVSAALSRPGLGLGLLMSLPTPRMAAKAAILAEEFAIAARQRRFEFYDWEKDRAVNFSRRGTSTFKSHGWSLTLDQAEEAGTGSRLDQFVKAGKVHTYRPRGKEPGTATAVDATLLFSYSGPRSDFEAPLLHQETSLQRRLDGWRLAVEDHHGGSLLGFLSIPVSRQVATALGTVGQERHIRYELRSGVTLSASNVARSARPRRQSAGGG